MIVQDNPTVSSSYGMGKTVEYTANMDGIMFDNMINGIYSNKIAAPIREISTNARDGHALNNCLDRPFDVSLPTRMDPVFSVRDYGCSLTEDDVMNIYSVLGKSTKRDSNVATGCLGLGSKSPFAYTSSFSITCWKDGFEEVYTSYKQSGGTPVISKVHKVRSNKEQGVMVAFAVKVEDIDAFNKEASKVFIGFRPRPNIIRSSGSFAWDDREPIIKTDIVEIMKKANTYGESKSYAISGSVTYPLKLDQNLITALKNHPEVDNDHARLSYPYQSKEEQLLRSTDMHIYFDIGELTTTTSREELSYDNKTCNNIVDKLVKIIKDQEANLSKRYDECKSLYEAQVKFANDSEEDTIDVLSKIIKSKLTYSYKGNKLWSEAICYNNYNNKSNVKFFHGRWSNNEVNSIEYNFKVCDLSQLIGKYKFGEVKPSFSFVKADQSNTKIPFKNINNNKFFVLYNDDTDKVNNRLRRMWYELNSNDKNILVRVEKRSDWIAFKKLMMIPSENITYLANLKPLLMPSKAKGAITTPVSKHVEVRKIVPSSYQSNQSNYRCVIDTTDKVKYIRVWQEGNSFFLTKANRDNKIEAYCQSSLSRLLQERINYLIDHDIIALNKVNKKLDDDFPHLFVDYEDHIKSKIKLEISKVEDFIRKGSISEKLGLDYTFYELINKIDNTSIPKMLETGNKTSSGTSLSRLEADILKDVERYFPIEYNAIKIKAMDKVKLIDVEKIREEHPMLHVLELLNEYNNQYSYRDNKANKEVCLKTLNQYCLNLKKEGK